MEFAAGNDAQNEPPRKASWGFVLLPYLLTSGLVVGILAGDPLHYPPLSALAVTWGAALAAVLAIHLVAALLVWKSPARELIVCAVIAWLGLYGYVQLRMQHLLPATQFLAAWSFGFLLLIWLCWRLRHERWLQGAATFAGFASLALVGMQGYQIGAAIWHDRQQLEQSPVAVMLPSIPAGESPIAEGAELPDIYYIVVDAYGRKDVLAELYDHDNGQFLNDLREREFYIADQSRANYHLTELSLASSLNMTHLPEAGLERFRTRAPVRQMIQDNAVSRFLSQRGYRTVSIASGKADTECRQFDRFVSPAPGLSIFQDVLLHTTAVPTLVELLPRDVPRPADFHRRRLTATLAALPAAAGDAEQPSFVLSHLMSPHPPFVFDAEGAAVDIHGQYLVADGMGFLSCHHGDRQLYRESYAAQLAYLNQRLLNTIDNILAGDREAVIVLQGDHGPRSRMNFDDPTKTDLTEAMGILNAIRLPKDHNGPFYPEMTPVNTFALILNHYFATDIRLQPDRSFFETDAYQFVDVTEAARQPIRPEVLKLPAETPSSENREEQRVTLNQP